VLSPSGPWPGDPSTAYDWACPGSSIAADTGVTSGGSSRLIGVPDGWPLNVTTTRALVAL